MVPPGQAMPQILTRPPPVDLEEEAVDQAVTRAQSEMSRLRNRNRALEAQMADLDRSQ